MLGELDELIRRSQLGNESAMMQIYKQFEPLLKKYAAMLSDCDALSSLSLFFFELIMKIELDKIRECSDGVYVSYIDISIQHFYIHLSKKESLRNKFEKSFSCFSDEEMFIIENRASHRDYTLDLDINDLLAKCLSPHDIDILNYIYKEGYTVLEVSKMLGISRQAVNQAKNRALLKLKNNDTEMYL